MGKFQKNFSPFFMLQKCLKKEFTTFFKGLVNHGDEACHIFVEMARRRPSSCALFSPKTLSTLISPASFACFKKTSICNFCLFPLR
jgi:hypothetical protein